MRFKSGNKGKVADAAEMYAALSILAILILLSLAASSSPNETKIAYTRDGVNFVSKERAEENVRFEYAKPGEYREVAVPLDTIIVGASSIPENLTISKDKEEGTKDKKTHVVSNQTAHASSAEGKYPYAAISIELLAVGGLLFFIALFFAGRDR